MSTENYTPGHTPNVLAFMQRRRAETHAAFFAPLLQPGMSLLDCGCGPGTITLGLARGVAPGRVVAIDQIDSQFDEARADAEREGLAVEFRAASVYELPFSDATFDAVFSHALMEHLAEPVKALREIRRVLKPGGFAGLRAPDWAGNLFYPDQPEIHEFLGVYQKLQHANGGDPFVGRKLAAYLRAAGFARVASSASYETYPEPGLIAEYLAHRIERSRVPGYSSEELARLAAAMREWLRHPDAFYAQTWAEAVGWNG
jgi:ubiquinone/menaquinone biosynthesis C-methylase UbiE